MSLYREIQWWVTLLLLVSVICRLILLKHNTLSPLKNSTISLLSVLFALPLVFLGPSLGLLLSMLNLLIIAAALKLLRLKDNRDYFQLVTLQLFIIACGYLFQQNLNYSLFYSVLIFMTLMSLAWRISPSRNSRQIVLKVGVLCLQALPIALIMFLLMPKLPPLWQVSKNTNATTGLSDTVTPGDIARLTQSKELAFRASFTGDIPQPHQRYWRALVLEHFDGQSWRISAHRQGTQQELTSHQLQARKGTEFFDYEVLTEPTRHSWLYALDIPISSNNFIKHNDQYLLRSRHHSSTGFHYQVRSYYQQPRIPEAIGEDIWLSQQLPVNGNPRTRAWVKELKQRYPEQNSFIQAVTAHFSQQNYLYTLTPPPMPTNMVDSLLFDYQRGFCAHYASAFAFIMRVANIPARLVTGYLGGEAINADTLSVYQYDAHAWVEIWDPKHGWKTYDPTLLVAPERIAGSLEQLTDGRISPRQGGVGYQWVQKLNLKLEEWDYLWSRWVVGFSQQQQLNLFSQLSGKLTYRNMVILSLGLLSLIAVLIVLYFNNWKKLFSSKPPQPLEQQLYLQALALLSQNGYHRAIWTGPEGFCQSMRSSLPPEAWQPFELLSIAYISRTYQPTRVQSEEIQQVKLKHALRQLKRELKRSLK